MRITLDRVALAALIKADPNFELELKSAVISEVGRRFFEKDSNRVIAAANPELFAQAVTAFQRDADIMTLVNKALRAKLLNRTSQYYERFEADPLTKQLIDTVVAEKKDRLINDATATIEKAYSDVIAKAVEKRLATTDIEAAIERRVERLVNAEIDKRADEKLQQRLADMRKMLA